MIAKQLEAIIERKISKFGISNQPMGHISQRFESLRAYGILPIGRVKNSQHLTNDQIVSGILSIISSQVGFSGQTVLIIKSLKPIGGMSASFQKNETFSKALESILENTNESFSNLIKVTASDNEIYTNSHCRAAIHYILNDQERVAYFVSPNALSLLSKGSEKNYDPSMIKSSVINDIVFYPSFFHSIRNSLQYEATMPKIQYPEERETDEKLEKHQRAEYLELTPNSDFLNITIDCQITWPKHEILIEFDGYKLVLMPKTREHTTSLHIDLHKNKITNGEARGIIHRFLSILTWCDDQYAVVQDGFSGGPVPIPVSKRNLAFSTAHDWIFNRKSPEDLDIRKAIAIYREGRNAEQNFLVSYAVLSYYKILEIHHKKDISLWYKNNYPLIKDKLSNTLLNTFEKHCGDKSTHNYLIVLCRHAVAHAGDPHNIDPDDYEKLVKLHVASQVLRELARHFISTEMKFSDHSFDGS